MMKNRANKTISILLAAVIFMSSLGLSLDLHYCQGQIKSFNLFGKAQSCHLESNKEAHCKKSKKCCNGDSLVKKEETSLCKKNCCSNKTIKFVISDDIKQLQTLDISLKHNKILEARSLVTVLGAIPLSKIIIPHSKYIPPLLSKDIPVLIQSFLF